METIIVDGVTYTKSSVAAKRHDYTADYVGQLCRSGKVRCEMVGRSWYVDEEDLAEHKATRYDSSSDEDASDTSSKEESAADSSTHDSATQVPKMHWSRKYTPVIASPHYIDDTAELIPAVLRTTPPQETNTSADGEENTDSGTVSIPIRNATIDEDSISWDSEISSDPSDAAPTSTKARKNYGKSSYIDGAEEAAIRDHDRSEEAAVATAEGHSYSFTDAADTKATKTNRYSSSGQRPGSLLSALTTFVTILALVFTISLFLVDSVTVATTEKYTTEFRVGFSNFSDKLDTVILSHF